jgi:hypothetical protein
MKNNVVLDFINKYVTVQFIVHFLLSKILNKIFDIIYKIIGNNLMGVIDEDYLEYKDLIVSFLVLLVIFFLYS